MMKQIFRFLAVLFVFITLGSSSFAYVYTEDSPASSSAEYELMNSMGAIILAHANDDSVSALAQSAIPTSLPLDQAVRAYILTPTEFLSHSESGTIGQIRDDGGYSWEVPVYFDPETGAYQYASFGYLDNGSFDYITVTAPEGSENSQYYLFYPDETLEILYEAGVPTDADVYLLSISDIYLTLVVAQQNDTFWVLPYADRPDLLGLENGVVTTLGQITQKTEYFLEQTAPDSYGLFSGGGAGKSNYFWGILIAAAILVCAAVWFFRKNRRTYTH